MAFHNFEKLKKILQCSECGKLLEWRKNVVHCTSCAAKIELRNRSLIFFSKSLIPDFDKPSYSSSNGYHTPVIELLKKYPRGIIVDFGAGNFDIAYPNVVQVEVSMYKNTDIVIGVEARLPFKDESVDGVVSLAVLEHVKDPFFYVSEIYRVLKPNGTCILDTAFLQPIHGAPSHFFNTSPYAVELLFKRFTIETLRVGPHQRPWIMLKWILNSYINGIKKEEDKKHFRNMTIEQLEKMFQDLRLIGERFRKEERSYEDFLAKNWNYYPDNSSEMRFLFDLTSDSEKELAAGYHLIAKKPALHKSLVKRVLQSLFRKKQ